MDGHLTALARIQAITATIDEGDLEGIITATWSVLDASGVHHLAGLPEASRAWYDAAANCIATALRNRPSAISSINRMLQDTSMRAAAACGVSMLAKSLDSAVPSVLNVEQLTRRVIALLWCEQESAQAWAAAALGNNATSATGCEN